MLIIDDLTVRIAGRKLLEGASARIPTGARVGLVGRNGTGKTTLFGVIAGDISAEQGHVEIPPRWRIGRLAQEAPDGPDSLLDVVLKAHRERSALLAEAETAQDPHRIAEIQTRLADIGAHAAPARAASILAGLGFSTADQQRPCSEFSGGWRMRVALAATLFAEPDLLLLDEPTNYLDLEGTLWLQDHLAHYPATLIVISHDRDLLDTAVGSILSLEARKLALYRGGYSAFERQRSERMLLDQKMIKKQEAQRKHLQAFVDRFRAKATKARQAQSRLKMLAKLEPITALVTEDVRPIHIPAPDKLLSPPIIATDDVEVGYEPGRPVLSGLSLRIDNDDRIALLGANGNGKSTLVNRMIGRREAVVQDVPGVTRDRVSYDATWNGRQFVLVDTGGWAPDAKGMAARHYRFVPRALVRMSLRELAARLDGIELVQIHRGVMVNAACMTSATRNEVGHLAVRLRGLERPVKVSRAFAHLFRPM